MSREDLEQVDSLRYTWQQLQATALAAHVHLLMMQPQFELDLRSNLDRFREDNAAYCHEYRNAGPMQAGLTPREASDRLMLFQVLTYSVTLVSKTCAANLRHITGMLARCRPVDPVPRTLLLFYLTLLWCIGQ